MRHDKANIHIDRNNFRLIPFQFEFSRFSIGSKHAALFKYVPF